LFLFINREKSEGGIEIKKAKNKYLLPEDIKMRINQKFPNPMDNKEVMKMMDEIGTDTFMVGKDQLIRSILIIADKDKNKIRQIIDSNYYGDGRDVIMESMGTPGNTNDHGMTPFERIKE
jgi:hypothetical protein